MQRQLASGCAGRLHAMVPQGQQHANLPQETSNASHQLQADFQLENSPAAGGWRWTCPGSPVVDDAAGSSAAAESIDIMHSCLRTTSGTLSEVAGLA